MFYPVLFEIKISRLSPNQTLFTVLLVAVNAATHAVRVNDWACVFLNTFQHGCVCSRQEKHDWQLRRTFWKLVTSSIRLSRSMSYSSRSPNVLWITLRPWQFDNFPYLYAHRIYCCLIYNCRGNQTRWACKSRPIPPNHSHYMLPHATVCPFTHFLLYPFTLYETRTQVEFRRRALTSHSFTAHSTILLYYYELPGWTSK